MTYSAEISRDNPTCILFVVDQSTSMSEKMATGKSKAEFVADALNKTLYTMITNCTKADGVRNYFEVGVIGYGGSGTPNGLKGALAGNAVSSISDVAENPLRVESRTQLLDDGAGGVLERSVKFPVWFEAVANGGTPMTAALTRCAEILVDWCDNHPNSYPPTVLHLTDGESTDGSPERVADAIRQISTNDGTALLLNAHISTAVGEAVQFPASSSGLANSYATQLFDMSSVLPAHVANLAKEKGYPLSEGARGFMFNADPKDIVNFFEIGTRPRLTVDR
ncbi:vWA domain-containing protein [Ruegeria arenilitoris]|uniref:vWA domain-containing protein n=1 Tax=Ruegeria arenilitoris TaxID=1173585 RepID=UPI00147CCF1B|nr:vWA domain-containing protein [Ruegeria arenilitoris]